MTQEIRFVNNLRRILGLDPLTSGQRMAARYVRPELVVRTLRMDRRPLHVRAREQRERLAWS